MAEGPCEAHSLAPPPPPRYKNSMRLRFYVTQGVFLSNAEIERARRSSQNYLLCWQAMSHHSIEEGTPFYRVRPKGHYIAHVIAQLSTKENPRIFSNFLNEDLMGRIVKLAKKQHRLTMVMRTLELYALSLQFRWAESAGERNCAL